MASLFPENGARMVFERLEGAPVRYRLSVYEAGGALHEGIAGLDGELSGWTSEPPEWVLGFSKRLVLGLAKKHREDGALPRKLTRWRDGS